MRDENIPDASCFAHSLQLCIHNSVLSSRSVSEMIAVARSLVGHFKHSTFITERLHKEQTTLSLPNHNLIQDVPTRWNSTFYLLERLIEQKRAIAVISLEDKSLVNLSAAQWSLAEKVVSILSPFEELTRSISAKNSLLSQVIPSVHALRSFLTSDHIQSTNQFRTSLIDQIDTRFKMLDENSRYTCATFLDPRFKSKFFSESATLLVKASFHSNSVVEQVDFSAPPPKKKSTNFSSFFDEMLSTPSNSVSEPIPLDKELESYSTEPCISRELSPDQWWKENRVRFPLLSQLARIYLSAPATSVPSESTFSTAGDVLSDHRSSLSPENAQMLIFIKRNAASFLSDSVA